MIYKNRSYFTSIKKVSDKGRIDRGITMAYAVLPTMSAYLTGWKISKEWKGSV